MKLIYNTKEVAVFDQFLTPPQFKKISNYAKNEDYKSVHQQGRQKIFDSDLVFIGPTYRIYENQFGTNAKKASKDMVFFLNKLLAVCPSLTDWIGQPFKSWKSISAQSYQYPQRTGLKWHNDGVRKGAFIFYTHKKWGANWGGELMISSPSDVNIKSKFKRPTNVIQSDPEIYPLNVTDGVYTAIAPLPNRLIVLKGGNPHCIKPVERFANAHKRCSISGFFHTEEDVELLMIKDED